MIQFKNIPPMIRAPLFFGELKTDMGALSANVEPEPELFSFLEIEQSDDLLLFDGDLSPIAIEEYLQVEVY